MAFPLPSSGGLGWNADLVDFRGELYVYTGRKGHRWICLGECGLRATGGGIRECVEGLLQEADRAAQHAHCLPPGIPQQGGAPEGFIIFLFFTLT